MSEEDRRMSPLEELLALVRDRLAAHEAERDGHVQCYRALEVLAHDARGTYCEAVQQALAILRGEAE